jgi:tryptophan halogenase
MKIKKIAIVGGGSAGWMAAAGLIAQVPGIEVTLIESPDIGIIGVGESTLAGFNVFLDALDLKDEDWMPHCNATYKTSIKFTDFKERLADPVSFHYPFGSPNVDNKKFGIMEWFLAKTQDPTLACNTFAEYYHDNVLMTNANKFTNNSRNELSNFNFTYHTAYHFDATLFGLYLRDHFCKPRYVKHILAEVSDVTVSDKGIDYITLEDNTKIYADLFIDCTGFKSYLLEEKLGVKFRSFGDTLLNDSAIATHIPYLDREREMETVTNCTAIEAGWVWNIPVWNRIGTGYVYSSKFATQEQAEEQLRQHLKSNRMICPDSDRADSAKFKHIKIRHGVHERSWEKNVVAIGLSNGFIEPLESTGLLITHNSIMKLIDTLHLKDGNVNQFDIDIYNSTFLNEILSFKDFVSMHYALSSRTDTDYWRKATQNTNYSNILASGEWTTLSDGYVEFAKQINKKEFSMELAGLIYIAAGMGYSPISPRHMQFTSRLHPEVLTALDAYKKSIELHRSKIERKIAAMPSHYEYLKKNIYKE